jgi:hypothetical protein
MMAFGIVGTLVVLILEFIGTIFLTVLLFALSDFIPKTWQQKLGVPEQIGCGSILFFAFVLLIIIEIFFDPLVIN